MYNAFLWAFVSLFFSHSNTMEDLPPPQDMCLDLHLILRVTSMEVLPTTSSAYKQPVWYPPSR